MSSKLFVFFLLFLTTSSLPSKKKCLETLEKSINENCCIKKSDCECSVEKICQGPSKRFLEALFGDCGLFACGRSSLNHQDLGSSSSNRGFTRKQHPKYKHINKFDHVDQWDPSLFETGLEN